MHGHKIWFFPDGDLPPAGSAEPYGHESLVILNPNEVDADVSLTVYHVDRAPDRLPPQRIAGQRVRCFRMDKPIGDYRIPHGQYALKVESTTPVVCQIGRMDVQQPNLAYYTVMGYAT